MVATVPGAGGSGGAGRGGSAAAAASLSVLDAGAVHWGVAVTVPEALSAAARNLTVSRLLMKQMGTTVHV